MLRVAVLVLIAACGSSDTGEKPKPAAKKPAAEPVAAVGPVMNPKDFDRSCTAATDCVVVRSAGCDPCACPTDAIASKEMARFDELQGKLACPEPDLGVRCSPCQLYSSACEQGRCVAVAKF